MRAISLVGISIVENGKFSYVIDIEIHSSAMQIGGKLALISLVIDVTERTRAEREVQIFAGPATRRGDS